MPFDSFGFPSVETRAPNEVEILDRMASILATPSRWRRGSIGSMDSGSHCLYGALNIADHGNSNWAHVGTFKFHNPAAKRVHDRLRWKASFIVSMFGEDAALQFNDERKYEDVMRLIAKTRKSFTRKFLR